MSLLMQALKKAERAKQNSLHEEELEKPSEAYDQVLSLAPQESLPPRAAPTAPVEPASDLRLEPLGGEPVQPDPAPPASAPPSPPPAPPSRPATRHAARPAAARAATTIDPATLRLAVLGTILLLVIAGFAAWFWLASTGPGAGASLPMVPMPLTDAPGSVGAANGPLLVTPGTDAPAIPPAQSHDEAGERTEQQQAMQIAAQAEIIARLQQQQQRQQSQQSQQQAATLPPVVAADNSQIHVLRSDVAPSIPPGVQSAYQAYTAGDMASASTLYDSVLQQDANNRDALLGLAAVALRQQQGQQAASLYLRLLELDPDDGDALAGLISLRQGDTAHGETRLKAMLQRAPDSGPVLFALGNLYAKQQRWTEAQQQFFSAYSAAPDNPDYAFNLAVGLDRLNQPALALTYYQRAVTLAQNKAAGFDRNAVARRMRELGAAPLAAKE
ncbi:tetratricopeptide repeat protein [Janthinobacterium agaricidamnosum]|uniref:Tetratricopeptide repeat family protein n=1 Tax=Janthinobacterium agaricidamnosum NBRC 102515 = DSM 9628 TaxID=1349767 RepID=W0V5V8_9BURK|nr:tetratricopeptide repeat protein [Janthinobacterium agaricidamnosum]CDG82743.1 tetratricopeptide repeat family protein [Janthinobacterium agaricidamnosum NBRC 102515 = DSM 9628]